MSRKGASGPGLTWSQCCLEFQRGEPSQEAVRMVHDRAYRVGMTFHRGSDFAESVASQVLAIASRKAVSVREGSKFGSWVHKTARHEGGRLVRDDPTVPLSGNEASAHADSDGDIQLQYSELRAAACKVVHDWLKARKPGGRHAILCAILPGDLDVNDHAPPELAAPGSSTRRAARSSLKQLLRILDARFADILGCLVRQPPWDNHNDDAPRIRDLLRRLSVLQAEDIEALLPHGQTCMAPATLVVLPAGQSVEVLIANRTGLRGVGLVPRQPADEPVLRMVLPGARVVVTIPGTSGAAQAHGTVMRRDHVSVEDGRGRPRRLCFGLGVRLDADCQALAAH